jgi:hypothetical protein
MYSPRCGAAAWVWGCSSSSGNRDDSVCQEALSAFWISDGSVTTAPSEPLRRGFVVEPAVAQQPQGELDGSNLVWQTGRPARDRQTCPWKVLRVDREQDPSQPGQRLQPIRPGCPAVEAKADHPVGHRPHDVVDAGEVPVEGGGVGADGRRERPRAKHGRAPVLDQVDGSVDVGLARQLGPAVGAPASPARRLLPSWFRHDSVLLMSTPLTSICGYRNHGSPRG